MPDIFDTIQAPQAQGDIFDQVHTTSMDDNRNAQDRLGMEQFWNQHPYMRALGVSAEQAVGEPIAQAVKGFSKITGKPMDVESSVDENSPLAAKVLSNLGEGLGTGAAATVAGAPVSMFNPFAGALTGFGALNAMSAAKNNQPVLPAFAQGAASAIPQAAAGYAGSKVAGLFNPIASQWLKPYLPNIGTATGMGTAAAATAPEGHKLEDFATGATFGALSPMGGPKQMTQEQYDAQVAKHGDVYRQILNPGKNIIKNVETKGKGDIDNSTNLAAELMLPINKDQNNKIDNTDARAQLKDATQPLHEQLNQVLASNPEPQFNLEDIKSQAIKQLESNPKFKNAQEFENGSKDISNLIDAEIRRNGGSPMINGVDLNNAKEGMWSVSYNQSAPNNFHAARQLGNVMKSAIEDGYQDNADVKALNQERGRYLQLDNLLAETHGNVIQKGKIGKYAMQAIGALTGHASHIPGGEIAGGWVAGKASDWMNDPQRITSNLSDRLKNIEITNPSEPKSFVKPQQDKSILGLPFIPQETPSYLQDRQNAPINPLGPQFESPRPIPNESGIDQFKSPKEGEIINQRGASAKASTPAFSKPEEIPQSVKDQAKEEINKHWAKGVMSPFNPLAEKPKPSWMSDVENAGELSQKLYGKDFHQLSSQEKQRVLDITKNRQDIRNSGGTSLGNEKGSIDTSGRTPEDLKLELERNLKYKNSREYRSDKSYREFIDAKIIDLQNAIKSVSKSPLGLNMATSGLVAGGMMFANKANANQNKIDDRRAINAIIGEAENQGIEGMRAVASAIRNRGNLRGVYGEKSSRVTNKSYSPQVYKMAQKAWNDSKSKDYSKGSIGWGSKEDWQKPGWKDDKTPTIKVKDQTFYVRKKA